jgi:DNA-binding phage protein
MTKSAAQVQQDLNMDLPPDEEFMALLAAAGTGDIVQGPGVGDASRAYAPREIEAIVLDGAVGALIAHARHESGKSLAAVGAAAGVSRSRVQQIEQSDNVEVATLARVAAACGYRVGISLQPIEVGKPTFTTILQASA